MSDLTIEILFTWLEVSPDCRAYKPSNPTLIPEGTLIGLDVPLKSEYVKNATKIVQAQLSTSENVPVAVLTPAGMRYCIDMLEAVMQESKLTKKVVDDNEDWEETESTEPTSEENTPADDKWDDEKEEDWN